MKKILILFSALIAMTQVCHARIQKPSVMVVPDSTWCIDNGFATTSSAGVSPDFTGFIAGTSEWDNVVSEINNIINQQGLDTVNLKTVLASHGPDSIYSASGADLILYLSWNIEKIGFRTSASVCLRALDRTNGKEAARINGQAPPSMRSDTATLIKDAIYGNIDAFCDMLYRYYTSRLNDTAREL